MTEATASGHRDVMAGTASSQPASATRNAAHAVMPTGAALLTLVLMASCAAGTSKNATNAILADASSAEGGHDAEGGPEAAGTDPAGGADGASADAPWAPISDAGADADSQDAATGVGLDATDLDAPGPDPRVGCGADAAEAGVCPLPRSTCANRRWLVFYDNAQCISDSCTWEKRYLDCGNFGCFAGRCQAAPTL